MVSPRTMRWAHFYGLILLTLAFGRFGQGYSSMASSDSTTATAAWRGIWLPALFVLTLAAGWSVLEWVMLRLPTKMNHQAWTG